ncbi:BON domain-containing protein [Mycolicibacterium sediminis]|uniref:Peptidoglycan-binding protein ArfA BON-like domain-containing protein n=1 Tax=Mycolicibacterium sediminis TaxID=1286180 RepID=A0A7I7R0Y3_9MYCO|nr:BON domain-containing protein [Mycolicibacterium sediminis]BBY31877.1 hypothetical protein MSEDJ_59730 [Mycolicibacterium sediminis]
MRPGPGWWAALLVVPLLLAVIGWAGFGDREVAGQAVPSADPPTAMSGAPGPPTPAPTTPAAAPPARSDLPFGPFSITRSTDGFVIGGKMPDEGQKSSLIEAIRMAMPGAVVGDELGVDPNVRVPDVALLAGVFSVTANIPDFRVTVDRGVLTLTGVAPGERERASVESAATEAWPGLPVVNDIRVK